MIIKKGLHLIVLGADLFMIRYYFTSRIAPLFADVTRDAYLAEYPVVILG